MIRTAISPRLAISSFRRATRRSLPEPLHRRLDERRVDDVLQRNGRLDEAVALPPRHLAADVLHPEPGAAILIGKAERDHRNGRARVAGRDRDHLVVRRTAAAGQHSVVVMPGRLHVALHEAHRAGPVRRELLRVEHRRDLPGEQVAAPRDDAAEPVGLGAAGKRLREDHGVDLLALERLEGGRHRLQRHDAHVLQAHAVLLEDVAYLVVEGGAELRHRDALALQLGHRADAGVVQIFLHHDRGQPVIGPLPPLIGHDPQLLAAEHDVVSGRCETGGGDIELPGRQRGRDGRRRLEVHQLRLDPELLEEPLLDADEDRGRRGELEDPDAGTILRRGRRRARHQRDQQHERDPLPHQPSNPTSGVPAPPAQAVRHGMASRSRRPSDQCETTPSSDSTTIPTMSFVVCIRLPAWSTRNPIPDSTAIISAATSSSSAVPAPSRSPAKIIGSADGSTTLRITDQRRAPKATAARTSSGSAWRTPVNVLMAIGKNTPSAITATFDGSPSPSQRMSSGSKAIFGIGNVAAMTGVPTASATAKKPTTTPTATPRAAPTAKPSSSRDSDAARWPTSSPERSISAASISTPTGDGKNRTGTQPTRATASHAATRPTSATSRSARCWGRARNVARSRTWMRVTRRLRRAASRRPARG